MKGVRTTCYNANHSWGECTCKTEVSEDKGFEFNGVTIVDPMLSECGLFFVDPVWYYGQAYINWLKSKRQ